MSAVDGWALVGTTFLLVVWAGCIVAGYYLGKYKGQVRAGLVITVILGPLGRAILAFIPRSHAAKVAEPQKQYEIKAEAARRAGYQRPVGVSATLYQVPVIGGLVLAGVIKCGPTVRLTAPGEGTDTRMRSPVGPSVRRRRRAQSRRRPVTNAALATYRRCRGECEQRHALGLLQRLSLPRRPVRYPVQL